MSREERYGTRDLAFSAWHRKIPRDDFTWLDIDHCAYCNDCKQVIFFAELAQDVGQSFKATTVTRNLANRLGVPALLIFYTVEDGEVTRFRIRRIAPTWTDLCVVEPEVLIEWIEKTRDEHVCTPAVTSAVAA